MKISVFITSYNQKEYLIEAIESVLSQTLMPFQVIIVDDCSSDGSQEVIRGYCSRYPGLIGAIYHAQNTGVAQVRIDALKAVKGGHVTYLDGDDRLLPSKLEKEASLLRKNRHVQIAYSNNYYMTEDGTHTGTWVEDEKPPQGDVFYQTFAREFPRMSLFRMELVNYNAWKEIGFHDPGLEIYEDYDMRIRLTKRLQAAYYDEPLSEIRCHNRGLSKSGADVHLKSIKYIYKKNRHLLKDLKDSQRAQVKKNIDRMMAQIAVNASIKYKADRQVFQAIKYLLRATHYDTSILKQLL